MGTGANAILFQTATCPTTAAAIPTSARTVNDANIYAATSLTGASASTFTAAMVGKVVSSSAHPFTAAPTITAVSADGTSATISGGSPGEYSLTDVAVATATPVTGIVVNSHNGTTLTSLTANFTTAGDVTIAHSVTGPGLTTDAIASVTSTTIAVLTTAVTANLINIPVAIGTSATSSAGPFNAASITPVTGTKLITKAPYYLPVTVSTGTTYNVCVFDTAASANVLATASYKVYSAPTITSATSSGPTAGGNTITVDGTNFSAATKATLGGTALTVKMDAAPNATTEFTATVPAHAAGNADLVVTTEGGPVTLANAYNYLNGINVQPQTTTATTPVVLDITGAGFTGYTFSSAAPGDALAHVLLSKGDLWAGVETDEAECTNVTVVSDLELICTFDPSVASGSAANTNPPGQGVYQVSITDNSGQTAAAALTDTKDTILTSGSTFTIAPY